MSKLYLNIITTITIWKIKKLKNREQVERTRIKSKTNILQTLQLRAKNTFWCSRPLRGRKNKKTQRDGKRCLGIRGIRFKTADRLSRWWINKIGKSQRIHFKKLTFLRRKNLYLVVH